MKHIVIIGIDGAGKTTLTCRLAENLMACGLSVTRMAIKGWNYGVINKIHDMTDKSVGMDIRYVGSVLDLIGQYIEVNQENGVEYVIWDRFSYCLNNYMKVLQQEMMELEKIMDILVRPDYVFLLDLDVHVARDRLTMRGDLLKDTDSIHFQSKLRKNYLDMAEERGFYVLDACKPISELTDEILSFLM